MRKQKCLMFNHIIQYFSKYRPTPKLQTAANTISYTLSAWDSIYNFVKRTMEEEPSLHVIEECTHLCKREYSSVLMAPNHTTIEKYVYGALGKALNFWPRLTKLACFNENCPGKITRVNELGIHLFIDADVRVGKTKVDSLRCSLSNLPTSLELGDEEICVKYRWDFQSSTQHETC